MSSQTGECQIDAIEGNVVKGWFKSVYTGNVGSGSKTWAAMFLWDAFSSLSGKKRDEDAIGAVITRVTFATPNQTSTKLEVEVSDPAVLEGLETGYWESSYVG